MIEPESDTGERVGPLVAEDGVRVGDAWFTAAIVLAAKPAGGSMKPSSRSNG